MRTAATGALRGTHRQKHIFVGQTRIASKLHYSDQTPATRALYMQQNTFWYHPDHLGSTNWVTDAEGEGYEHFTYTPYGEAWVEEHLSTEIHRMSHRFTGQELDPETGLYAFPARNYDPRTSRWLSADPALEEYLPKPGQKPGELLGEGGVFDPRNLAVYHYGGNSPLRYTDPTGGFKDGSAARELLNAAQQNPGATAAVAAAVVKLGPLALLGLAMLALQGSEVDSGEDDTPQTLYHYSPSPQWRGNIFEVDQFLTDDPTLGSDEAREKLALPNVPEGEQLYLYTLEVEPGDARGPSPVQPKRSNITGKMLDGGGTEYQANRDLLMTQTVGVPVAPPEVD